MDHSTCINGRPDMIAMYICVLSMWYDVLCMYIRKEKRCDCKSTYVKEIIILIFILYFSMGKLN